MFFRWSDPELDRNVRGSEWRGMCQKKQGLGREEGGGAKGAERNEESSSLRMDHPWGASLRHTERLGSSRHNGWLG